MHNAKKNQMKIQNNENKILNRNFSNNFLAKSNNNNLNDNNLNKKAKGEYSSNTYREHRSSNVSSNIKGSIRTDL